MSTGFPDYNQMGQNQDKLPKSDKLYGVFEFDFSFTENCFQQNNKSRSKGKSNQAAKISACHQISKNSTSPILALCEAGRALACQHEYAQLENEVSPSVGYVGAAMAAALALACATADKPLAMRTKPSFYRTHFQRPRHSARSISVVWYPTPMHY